MSADAIVAFKSDIADAEDELRALGLDYVERVFVDWQKIVSKALDHRGRQVFRSFREIPLYVAAIGDKFSIYAVETEPDGGGLTVVVILAGTFAKWGKDLSSNSLLSELNRRLIDYFNP